MELPTEILEQIANITRPKIEEHMLNVLDKSTHEVHLSQQLQIINKQYNLIVTFLTGYNGISIDSNSIKRFCFTVSINDDGFNVFFVFIGACELESSNDEIKRIFIQDSYFTEENYPFIIKPKVSTLGTIIEIQPNFIGTQISFVHDDTFRDLLAFDSVVMYEKHN